MDHNPRQYAKVIVEFYQAFTGNVVATVEDIPDETLQFIAGMDYWDLLRPILVRALRAGSPVKPLAEYWGVPKNTVRDLRRRYGFEPYQTGAVVDP